jgi:hypothetical protein
MGSIDGKALLAEIAQQQVAQTHVIVDDENSALRWFHAAILQNARATV